MTQKELLYIEDAIEHEVNIVSILNDDLNKIENDEIKTFLEKAIKKHTNIKEKLTRILEEESNER